MRTDGINQREGDALSPGELLLQRISYNTDFPTFSKYIIEINRQISSESKYASASDLSNTILKDYALTSKLLKVVNSAFYSITGGKVTTVTRAVVLLGYEKVGLLATNLLLFGLMKNKSSEADLKEAFIRAFWSGLIAKNVADNMALEGEEEAFICAMLHNLGSHIVMLYLPDRFHEIQQVMANEGLSETKASKTVLSISFEQLGLAVAARWNFPGKIINSMERLSEDELQHRKGTISSLQILSNFSNELGHVINETKGKHRESSIASLTGRYSRHVPLSTKQLSRIINDSLEELKKHADLLEIDVQKSLFLRRLKLADEEDATKPFEPEKADDSAMGFTQEITPDAVILSGLQDMSTAMLGEFTVNDIALMALESMYRGFGFNRVVFFVMRKDRKRMVARFGFGADIEHIVNQVGFETGETHNIFSIATARNKDLIIEDVADEHIHPLIPSWFSEKMKAPAFVFLPIAFEKATLGAFYADREAAGPPLPGGQYNFINMLRNQLLLAVKYRR